MNYTFLSVTILLLLITDPIGNIPVFANALKHVPPERRAKVILREILIAFGLLLTFMFVGEGFLGSTRFQCNNWRYAKLALARGWSG